MTRQQHDIINAIWKHFEEHGIPPTVREICARCGYLSPNAIERPMHQLRAAGWLEDVTTNGQRAARCVMPAGLRGALVKAARDARKSQEVGRAA